MTVERLPLFPLPLVLFPGAALPLHVFEPRYRALLADCQRGDGRFGIVLASPSDGGLAPGLVGCVACLRDVQLLGDGRANIMVEGTDRFALSRVVAAGTPYQQADVTPWTDLAGIDPPELVRALDAAVRDAFRRVADAARTIADDQDPVPQLPDDPSALSFTIAAAVEFDLPVRQRLLASRSCAERLRELQALLGAVLPEVEQRAAVHVGAKTNGHGPHAPPGEP